MSALGQKRSFAYAVIEAPDGPASLKVLKSKARIDLLITDVGLPGGMNGRQIADPNKQKRRPKAPSALR
jgi:CheY-like chemotaxis protein